MHRHMPPAAEQGGACLQQLPVLLTAVNRGHRGGGDRSGGGGVDCSIQRSGCTQAISSAGGHRGLLTELAA